jgi:threonine efflux protein
MGRGREHVLVFAAEVLTGSIFWSFLAAFGLGAVMAINAWLFEVLRYFRASYLLCLSYKLMRSAFTLHHIEVLNKPISKSPSAYSRGLLIYLPTQRQDCFLVRCIHWVFPRKSAL